MALTAALALALSAAAQDGQIVKDKQNLCRITVPSDWKTDKAVFGVAASADKKATAMVRGLRAGADYRQTVQAAKTTYSVTKILEESEARTVLAYTRRNGKPGAGLYVATGGSQICTATVDFESAAFEGRAQKIAASVQAVK